MSMTDVLEVSRGAQCIHRVPLLGPALEVGSDPSCDLVLGASGVPARAWLVVPANGTVHLYDLRRSPALCHRRVFPIACDVPVGGGYRITRKKAPAARRVGDTTETLSPAAPGVHRVALVQGKGHDARAISIGERPVSVGSSEHCTLVLSDRAASAVHCRLEPFGEGVAIRDLGSTNGTWVDGVRVRRAVVRPGAIIRIGRTEFRAAGLSSSEAGATPIASSSAMLSVMADVDRFAPLPWPALIRGETGVGKELVARALHAGNLGRTGRFIALNGGGLPRELVESELFGHERGAFTGAVQVHRGAFEQADGGTLFLDEVAELPSSAQTRLLRVLEDWQVRRLGSEVGRSVDVRLVCATHRDLRAMVRRGEFRADLFYRINRLVIDVPPLRERPEDIEPMAQHFLAAMVSELGPKRLSRRALARLRANPWPGNVRELRNALEVAAACARGASIELGDVDRALRSVADASPAPTVEFLRGVLADHGGNFAAAARAVGMPRSTLRDRLKGAAASGVEP